MRPERGNGSGGEQMLQLDMYGTGPIGLMSGWMG